jgi:hypothetical protein
MNEPQKTVNRREIEKLLFDNIFIKINNNDSSMIDNDKNNRFIEKKLSTHVSAYVDFYFSGKELLAFAGGVKYMPIQ